MINLTHASGYKYGNNYFNADLLLADKNDPASVGSNTGSQEVYVVYRHTLDLGKVTGADLKFGPVRGLGLTAGFDINTKDDAGYNSKKTHVGSRPDGDVRRAGFFEHEPAATVGKQCPV